MFMPQQGIEPRPLANQVSIIALDYQDTITFKLMNKVTFQCQICYFTGVGGAGS